VQGTKEIFVLKKRGVMHMGYLNFDMMIHFAASSQGETIVVMTKERDIRWDWDVDSVTLQFDNRPSFSFLLLCLKFLFLLG